MSDAADIVVLAALPREVKTLVAGTRPEARTRSQGIWLYRLPGMTVAAAGMGAARVAQAFAAAIAGGTPRLVISAGLAGACTRELAPGAVAEAGTVVDIRTGERFRTEVPSGVLLATGDTIADVAEKRRLAASYGAALVDMEAAAVGRLAWAHGYAFRAVKAISDAHDFELAGLGRFATSTGQFRTGAFALHTALHPGRWRGATLLGRNSGRALAALARRLREIQAAGG